MCLSLFIKIRLQHRCFPVKFAKFSRTRTLNICQRLLLWSIVSLTFFSLLRNKKIAKIWKNRINRTYLPKIILIALCEEHCGRPCFKKSADLGRKLMNTKELFIFNLVFDLWYIVAAFSRFLCLLGEVLSYLFYSKRPEEVNWWTHANHIFPKRTRKKRRARKKIQAQMLFVNFAEKNTFLRTSPVAASEDKHDETELLHMTSRLNKCYLWIIRCELFWQPVKMDT